MSNSTPTCFRPGRPSCCSDEKSRFSLNPRLKKSETLAARGFAKAGTGSPCAVWLIYVTAFLFCLHLVSSSTPSLGLSCRCHTIFPRTGVMLTAVIDDSVWKSNHRLGIHIITKVFYISGDILYELVQTKIPIAVSHECHILGIGRRYRQFFWLKP